MRLAFVLLALAPLTSVAAEPVQAYVSLTVLKDGREIDSQGFVASAEPGFYSKGTQNNYPSASCGPGSAVLRSVPMFSGVTIGHRLANDGIDVEINRYAVQAPEVASVTVAQCTPVAPRQQLLLSMKTRLPLHPATGEVELGEGYTLRYTASPEG